MQNDRAHLRRARLPLLKLGVLSSVLCLSAAYPRAQWGWRPVPELNVRSGFALAYDPVRERVVMFGGHVDGNGAAPLTDTWEWNGVEWEFRRPSTRPPARTGHAMAYDPISARILVFGGNDGTQNLNDTWLWDGREWQQAQTPNAPVARRDHRLATDPSRGRVVLFGGRDSTVLVGGVVYQDTWEWDGRSWNQIVPASFIPPARCCHGMAFNARTGRVSLFGGIAGFSRAVTVPVFEWDGRDWVVVPVNGGVDPGLLGGVDGEPDPVSGGVLMYGGFGSTGSNNNLYRWDGSRWTLVPANASPGRGNFDSLVIDVARNTAITLGPGHQTQPGQCDIGRDTWGFDLQSNRWSLLHVWPKPTPGIYSIAHDARRDRFILHGGIPPGEPGCPGAPSTWSLTDRGFERLTPSSVPPGAGEAVFHGASGQIVLYGGDALGVTWVWDGTDWNRRTYTPSPGGGSNHVRLSYDPGNRRVILYWNQEVWAWDPTGWSQVASQDPTLPSTTRLSTFDAGRGRLVVFGADSQGVSGTWEWDGSTWTRSPTAPPPGLTGARMTFVPPLGGCLVYGGSMGAWLWDGMSWSQFQTAMSLPFSRFNGIVGGAYDANRRRLRVLYVFAPFRGLASEVWDLSFESLTSARYHPRPGEQLGFGLRVPSESGKPWLLGLAAGLYPGIPIRPHAFGGSEVFPLPPDWLLHASVGLGLGGVLDGQGTGGTSVYIPVLPALVGFEFHAAAITVGPGPTIDHISNPVSLQVVQ